MTECIEAHFSTSGPRTSHPPPSVAIDAAVAASMATPSQAGSIAGLNTGSGSLPSSSFAQRRRTTGMVVYHASEKDCVGEDEEGAQECVICFEEFTVGDEMGRLECLCKFHKVYEDAVLCLWAGQQLTMGCLGVYTSMVGYEGSWILSCPSRRTLKGQHGKSLEDAFGYNQL